MGLKAVSRTVAVLLLVTMLFALSNMPVVAASETIYIRADGSIDPPTVPIQHNVANPFFELSGIEWNKTYGGTDNDDAYSVVQTTDGGYAVAGLTRSYGAGPPDMWLIKTSANGNLQWSKTYGGTSYDGAKSLVQTSDGGYVIAGYTYSFGAGGEDAWLIKTDGFGNVQWNKTFGDTKENYANSVVQTSDGGYALAGLNYSDKWDNDFWLVKTDSTGNLQWSGSYGGNYIQAARSIIQTSDGGYALAGTTTFGYDVSTARFWLVKTNAFGYMTWNKVYDSGEASSAASVVQTTDGGYAIAGTVSVGTANDDFWLIKTDMLGNPEWNKTYGSPYDDSAATVVQTTDGGYAIAGTVSVGLSDVALIKTDPLGNQQWVKIMGGSKGDGASDVKQTTDGGYIVAGSTYSFGAGGMDFWLVKVAEPQHDIAITNVTPSKTVVGQGYSLNINVTATNQGDYTETFNITVYVNTTSIASQTITLSGGSSTTITLAWNTSGFAGGNYTIKAMADTVLGETNPDNNNCTDGWMLVTKVGDLGGGPPPEFFKFDGKADASDLALFIKCYKGLAPPKYMYLADLGSGPPPQFFKCDGKVDASDLALFIKCYKGLGP